MNGREGAAAKPHPRREGAAALRARAVRVLDALAGEFPDAKCALEHENPLELLVATILSAQCTDVRVNLVTPALFAKYRTAAAYAAAPPGELEDLIRTCGLYQAKAKNIRAAMAVLARDWGGLVPPDRKVLEGLPGVGRKTANVVLANAFGVPAIAVDTHVGRLARRLGFSRHEAPAKVEADLMAVVPEARWNEAHHLLIWHGRKTCGARRPDCGNCRVRNECPSAR